MNDIYHRRYVIEMDVWDAKKKLVDDEMTELVTLLRSGKLVRDAGNVRIRLDDERRILSHGA